MSKAHAQRCAGPSDVGHFAPGLSTLLERQIIMRSSIVQKSAISHHETDIGRELARRQADILLTVDGPYALVQCQVSSAVAAAMLALLKGKAAGQFRALAGNLVEIDAAVTLATAQRMLIAKSKMQACLRLH